MAKKEKTVDENSKSVILRKKIDNVGKALKELYEITGLDEDGEKVRKEKGYDEAENFFMIHQRDALELYMFCLENHLTYILGLEEKEGGDESNGNS